MLGIERGVAAKNIFNLGHDHFLTVLEVVRIILEELGLRDVPLEFAGGQRGWLGDSPLVHLDTTRIKALGWQPETSIEEGIRRTVRYLRANPHLLQIRD
jgi:UDP-glucose 4-epimerase